MSQESRSTQATPLSPSNSTPLISPTNPPQDPSPKPPTPTPTYRPSPTAAVDMYANLGPNVICPMCRLAVHGKRGSKGLLEHVRAEHPWLRELTAWIPENEGA
ncbi:hypothetical protein CVT26_000632 [Gymnopilus dilepis]|uniref:Uncharacterized protein n=1 Tax=Gymnopilus dilepis TaxID=231916 RepID=A0A409Y282_9AGAR|nr:hypothetical protein CVT26_000632 [Gymnopilus dilepis]